MWMALARTGRYNTGMPTPFPGMDPYLEHPALWPDVHNRLLAAISDTLTPLVAPRYSIGLERRTYFVVPDDVVFIGRPDIAVIPGSEDRGVASRPAFTSDVAGRGLIAE